MDNIDNSKTEFDKVINVLQDELARVRVGRATPAMVEDLIVEAYGSKSPIKQVASISVPEMRTLLIQPWDKSIIKDIEKAIVVSDIGINPVNEGNQIRLTVPQLTEESRKQLVKAVGEKLEKCRISIRQLRDRFKDDVVKGEKNNEITEDDKFDQLKKLDEIVKKYNDQVKEIGEHKENEIMTI